MTDGLTKEIFQQKTLAHPCFHCGAGENARIHLPVAPKCNIQCNYCVRKFDCTNESRPGVTSRILRPQEAVERFKAAREDIPNLTVVGIAGPGDALANWEETQAVLSGIRAIDPDITFCLSTNGLLLPAYAPDLIRLGVTHITVTLNAVDPSVGAQIYQFVDFMGTRYTGQIGASVLLANQLAGIKRMTNAGIVCKVNIVAIKGINDTHIETIVQTVKELGVYMTNIIRHIPVEGSALAKQPQMDRTELNGLRRRCEGHVRQMYHCRQCRADAAGTLDSEACGRYEALPAQLREPAAHAPAV